MKKKKQKHEHKPYIYRWDREGSHVKCSDCKMIIKTMSDIMCCNRCPAHEVNLLIKAFNIMREIAIEANNKSGDDFGNRAFGDDFEMLDAIDKEFEDRMSAGEVKK